MDAALFWFCNCLRLMTDIRRYPRLPLPPSPPVCTGRRGQYRLTYGVPAESDGGSFFSGN